MSTRDLLRECEQVLTDHDALHRCVAIEPRRREDQHADVRLLFTERAWLQSPAGEELIATLQGHPAVASALRRKSAVLVRFDDAVLASLEWRLAAGEITGMQTADVLAGHRFTVGFVGPNTNKALHVGHLRNVFLGQALASALTCAGASVQRHTLIGDIGRRVCEAMGGYRVHHDRQTPAEIGMPGDRFVELCSRDYVSDRGSRVPAAAQPDDPNAEEREPCGDLADRMMLAWLQGEEYERGLWHRLREWVLTGHESTLARLGVIMDRRDFESEGIERALALIAAGLKEGTLIREETGAAIYKTGRSEYTTMVLLRRDGVPTEYARLLGTYHRIFGDLDPGATYIELVGIEWQPATAVLRELLRSLPHAPSDDAYSWIFHGSVTDAGRKMGSSTGEVVWIDDLLDRVAAGPGVASLEELAGGALSAEELADLVVRGTFLCAPTAQPLEFALEHLLERGPGPRWTIAEAWCRAQRPQKPGKTAPVARTAAVQSQLYRRSLCRAVEKLEVTSLTTYLFNLSEACLAAPAPGPAAAPMLRRVLSSLGFLAGEPGGPQTATASGRTTTDRQHALKVEGLPLSHPVPSTAPRRASSRKDERPGRIINTTEGTG
jgi:arginyl-tRNA synthetase